VKLTSGIQLSLKFQAAALLILFGLFNLGCWDEKSEPETISHSRAIEKGQSLETPDAEQVDFEKRESVQAEKSARFLRAFYETEELLPKFAEMEEVEKDHFDEVHQRLKTAQIEELEHLRPLDERTLGYMHVGRHGELLYATPQSTHDN
jgi:hypothetical protein